MTRSNGGLQPVNATIITQITKLLFCDVPLQRVSYSVHGKCESLRNLDFLTLSPLNSWLGPRFMDEFGLIVVKGLSLKNLLFEFACY